MDIRSGLYANAIRRILVQELDDCQVIISEAPELTAQHCRLFHPYALLMEATGYSPGASRSASPSAMTKKGMSRSAESCCSWTTPTENGRRASKGQKKKGS